MFKKESCYMSNMCVCASRSLQTAPPHIFGRMAQKRFVVSNRFGRFAQMGVLFELEELKEVSEQTKHQIKYVRNHKVTINACRSSPNFESNSMVNTRHLFACRGDELEETADDSSSEGTSSLTSSSGFDSEYVEKLASSLRDTFWDLVETQRAVEEDIRFTRASVSTLASEDGPGPMGLGKRSNCGKHSSINVSCYDNKEFQEPLQAFLKKQSGLKEDELPSAVGSKDLQDEVKELQQEWRLNCNLLC